MCVILLNTVPKTTQFCYLNTNSCIIIPGFFGIEMFLEHTLAHIVLHLRMAKQVKSQLEIYMDGLDGVCEEELLPETEQLAKSGPILGSQRVLEWGVIALCMIITGLIEDAMCVVEQAGDFNLKSKGITCEGLLIVCARRVIQLLVSINVLKLATCSASSFSTASWLVYQCNIAIFYVIVLLPVSVGMFNLWLFKRAKHKRQLAQYNTECLLSVIKRIQLVRMGSSISHPMPPVAKLEESFLRTNLNNETNLSCREIRKSVRCALIRLQHAICCNKANMRDNEVATIACLEQLSRETFCSEKEWLFIAQWDMLSAKLICLQNTCWDMIGYQSMYRSNATTEGDSIESAEKQADPWQALALCTDCVIAWLTFPLHLSMLVAELDVYLHTCQNLSGTLYQDRLPNNTTAMVNSMTEQSNNRPHSYADTYLTIRQKMARLRAAYDDIGTRLWLAEQQLCKAPFLQCLLPDALHTAMSCEHKVDQNDHVHHLDSVLDTLSHNTRTLSSQTPHLTHNEILEGVELILSGLPTLRDFELLCEDLQLLRDASRRGSTPAQCKLDRTDPAEAVRTQDASENASGSGVNTISALGEFHQRESSTQSVYEANDLVSGAAAPCISSLDPTQTSSILDVYTTIIPRRAIKAKKDTIDSVDAAMAAQERAQAKMLFRELNQHLRRMHHPATSAVDPVVGVPQAGALPVLAAGCYTQQRVRNIGTAEPENEDFPDEMEVKIETNFMQVDSGVLGLNEDSDDESETEEGHQESHKGGEDKTYRVGSMLLTSAELQASNLPDSRTPSHSVVEFQNEMRQALLGMQRAAPVSGEQGLPLSAFASALRSNHLQEATFGDELSD